MKSEPQQHTISADGEPIAYEVIFSRRTTLALQVDRDGAVRVRAPLRTPLARIAGLVRERAGWIRRHQQRFAALAPSAPSPTYAAGEQCCLLGRSYTLAVRVGTPEQARIVGEQLEVTARSFEPEQVARVLDRWYRAEAARVFAERLAACWPLIARPGLAYPTIMPRRMRTRWGSCSHDGRIRLNVQLVEAPLPLIDYVVIHELCHLRELNHGPRFYALMDAALPDWRERRRALDAIRLR